MIVEELRGVVRHDSLLGLIGFKSNEPQEAYKPRPLGAYSFINSKLRLLWYDWTIAVRGRGLVNGPFRAFMSTFRDGNQIFLIKQKD